MTGIRRIIAWMTACAILISGISVLAADDGATVVTQSQEDALRLLRVLDIIDRQPDELSHSETITRGAFADIACRLLGVPPEDPYRGALLFADVGSHTPNAYAIYTLQNMGYLRGSNGFFRPNDPITYNEAVKVLVCVLGFGAQAELRGGYPTGYLAVAASQEVTKGIQAAGDAPLTLPNAVLLAYQTLHACVAVQTMFGAQQEWTTTPDKTLLSEVHRIAEGEGILRGTHDTLLTGRSTLPAGQVMIGSERFGTGALEADRWLGYSVQYYYRMDDNQDPHELIYLQPTRRNVTLTIQAKQINQFEDGRYAYYETEESVRETYVDVPKSAMVLFNGRYVTRPFDQYFPENGSVTLLDNTGDGAYDVLFIRSYTVLVAGYVDAAEEAVYDKYQNGNRLDLEADGKDESITIKMGVGDVLTVADILRGDVLTIARSQDQKQTEVTVSRETVEGVVEEVYMNNDTLWKAVVNGQSYETLNSLCSRNEGQVQAGEHLLLRLDAEGRIAAVERTGQGDRQYGFLVDAVPQQGLDGTLLFKIFTDGNQFAIFEGAKKIKVNGETITNTENVSWQDPETGTIQQGTGRDKILSLLYSGAGTGVSQMVLYTINSAGSLISIETPRPYSDALDARMQNELRMDCPPESSYKYKSGPQMFGGKVRVSSGLIVFCVPDDVLNERAYTIKRLSYFVNDNSYSRLTAYSYEKDAPYSDVLLMRGNYGAGTGSIDVREHAMVVETISEAIDSSGNEVQRITGVKSGSRVSYNTEDPMLATEMGVERGDIIRFALDGKNQIVSIELNYDCSEQRFYTGTDKQPVLANPTTSDYYAGKRFQRANVYSVDNGTMRITTKDPADVQTAADLELVSADKASYIYQVDLTRDNAVTQISFESLVGYQDAPDNYSQIILYTYYGDPRTIVVYK